MQREVLEVLWEDGTTSELRSTELDVEASRVDKTWDLGGVIAGGFVATSTSTVKLAVTVADAPYILTGEGRGKYKAAPWRRDGSKPKKALSWTTADLLAEIQAGDVKWFYPEKASAPKGGGGGHLRTKEGLLGTDFEWSALVAESDDSDSDSDSNAPSCSSGGDEQKKKPPRRRFGLRA